jgi:hypothetical protein
MGLCCSSGRKLCVRSLFLPQEPCVASVGCRKGQVCAVPVQAAVKYGLGFHPEPGHWAGAGRFGAVSDVFQVATNSGEVRVEYFAVWHAQPKPKPLRILE